MTAGPLWTEGARRGFLAAVAYLAERSPHAALRLIEDVERHTDRLRGFPASGRRVPETPDEDPPPREVIVSGYRLVYVLRGRSLEVLAFFHGRRQFPSTPPRVH